jgi:alkylhydroperoxidase family enzyme
MSRIPAAPAAAVGPIGRAIYRYAVRRFGVVPEPLAVAGWHRGLMRAMVLTGLIHRRTAHVLPVSVSDLAVYRVAVNVGCSWCVDFGTMLQRLRGLDIDRLRNIDGYATDPAYSAEERLALAYADAMSAQPMAVTDELVAQVVDRFGRDGALELTHVIALEDQRARFNHALGIADQGFTSGEACRVPTAESKG